MEVVYNIVNSLKPHFFSLREIGENVSLDIKIPTKWKYDGLITFDDDKPFAIKVQDKKTDHTLISLISPATVIGYGMVFKYAEAVISINIEEEQKAKLFNEKVDELKKMFLSSPLDKLKDISFDGKDTETGNALSNSPSTGEIVLGNDKGTGKDE